MEFLSQNERLLWKNIWIATLLENFHEHKVLCVDRNQTHSYYWKVLLSCVLVGYEVVQLWIRIFIILEEDSPPALPEKTRSKGSRRERHPSQYDNVPDSEVVTTTLVTSQHHAVTSHTQTVRTGDEVDSQHQSHEAMSLESVASVNSNQGGFFVKTIPDVRKGPSKLNVGASK